MIMTEEPNPYELFLERYEAARVPWDDPLPPPEIESLAAGMAPGRALDLGCGFGRTAIYLARRGWSVDGIDFIPAAIEEARQRASAANVGELAQFHVAAVDELGFLEPPYDLAIDIGCMHSFSEAMLGIYRDELVRLLGHGGRYVLFAHLRDEATAPNEEGPRGIPEAAVIALLQADFELEALERGVTEVEDRPPWNSAWFWYRRR